MVGTVTYGMVTAAPLFGASETLQLECLEVKLTGSEYFALGVL